MIFLKLHTLEVNGESEPFTINMSRVDDFASDGAGHTQLWYSKEEYRKARESYEDVNKMLSIALSGVNRVVEIEDLAKVYA